MPTFTALAFERLIEPRSHPRPPQATLYATPESTPLPDSPSSFPPSPFIVNHKRRGPRLQKAVSLPPPPSEAAAAAVEGDGKGVEVEDGRGAASEGEEGDDFFDPRETMSMGSVESCGNERVLKPSTPMADFYDAFDELASEGTPRSVNVEDDLREMRMNVLMEIERRKQAEEALENLQSQWQRLSHQLSLAGLVLPIPPTITEEIHGPLNLDPAEELSQQVVIARTVAHSIARACTRAEIEPLIELKNFEIARLSDRLQYYETANREMSQRNQEVVEMARQRRHTRKRRQRWLWSTLGLTVSIGASALAWYFVPLSKAPSDESSVQPAAGTE